jgi:hypothetical protein
MIMSGLEFTTIMVNVCQKTFGITYQKDQENLHFLELGNEYKYRYGKEHASITKLKNLLSKWPDNIEISTEQTSVAQAMPDKYKDEDPVKAYRNYCINEKTYAKWEKGRKKPEWWT